MVTKPSAAKKPACLKLAHASDLGRPVESDTPTGASGLARALRPYPAGSTHSYRVGLTGGIGRIV